MFNFKCLILNCLVITSLIANDGFEDEDEFGGDEIIEVVKLKKNESNELVTYGSISASSNYSYKNKDTISSAKISMNIKLEYVVNEFHKIKSTIKAYKRYKTNIKNDRDFDINELTVEGTFYNGVDVKIGRQIIVWGKSDNIRITDTINPLDSTTPGMVDIEDLRLGKFMTKFDYFIKDWRLSAILISENRYSLTPKIGSDYYIASTTPDTPSNSFDNSGVALSASANFQGQDIAFYYLNQYVDNKTYRSNMLGLAYNKVIDSFLLKTEIAYFINQCDKSHCDNYDSSTVDDKIDSLIGLEYSGISDGSISLEIANKNDDIQYALRYTQSFINQTLDFTALYSGFGKDFNDNGFIRTWVDYDIDDELSFNFGVIDYLDTNNDRVFASLEYNF